MLWIARQTGSRVMQTLSSIVYLIVIGRLGLIDLPREFPHTPIAVDTTLMQYVSDLARRLVVFGVPVLSLFGARWLFRKPVQDPSPIGEGNDLQIDLDDSGLATSTGWGAAAIGFVFLNFEAHRSLGYFYAPLQLTSLTWLWLGLALVILRDAIARKSDVILSVAILVAAATIGKLLIVDIPSWHLTHRLVYTGNHLARDLAVRIVDFGAIIAFLAVGRKLILGESSMGDAAKLLGTAALTLLFLFMTLEANTLFSIFLERMRLGGISIVWSLFALGLLLRGIVSQEKAIRVAGLALFTVVAFKVFLIDLARLEALDRICALVILGILILCGSLLYLKFRESFSFAEKEEEHDHPPTAEDWADALG